MILLVAIALLVVFLRLGKVVFFDKLVWVNVGDNQSVLINNFNVLVGPCHIELCEMEEYILGNAEGDDRWFTIDKKLSKMSRLNDCGSFSKHINKEAFRFETIQSRWEREKSCHQYVLLGVWGCLLLMLVFSYGTQTRKSTGDKVT